MNMLRGSRMNPKLSAWDQVCGVYDYNSTPIGPPGTRVLVHEKANERGTWAPHGDELRYCASDMILWIDSDASYLSEPKSRSTCADYHFLCDRPHDPTNPPQPHDTEPMHNAPVYVMCNILKEVVSAASEADFAGLFHNGKEHAPSASALKNLDTHNHLHL